MSELKCGRGGGIKLPRYYDGTCKTVCVMCRVGVDGFNEAEAISAFRKATRVDEMERLKAEIKRLRDILADISDHLDFAQEKDEPEKSLHLEEAAKYVKEAIGPPESEGAEAAVGEAVRQGYRRAGEAETSVAGERFGHQQNRKS